MSIIVENLKTKNETASDCFTVIVMHMTIRNLNLNMVTMVASAMKLTLTGMWSWFWRQCGMNLGVTWIGASVG